MESAKTATRAITDESSKTGRHRSVYKNAIVFLHTRNEQSEKRNGKNNSIYNNTKKNKMLWNKFNKISMRLKQ